MLCTAVLSPMSAFRPGFSTFTFARVFSRFGHRPLCDRATPRGISVENVTSTRNCPVSLDSTTSSPSLRSRAAASNGWTATVAGPIRAAIFSTLAKLSLRSYSETGDKRRKCPAPRLESTRGSGLRGCPSASARAEVISMRPLGVGNVRSANCMTGDPVTTQPKGEQE